MSLTLWFTGIPQSGKTTLSRIAAKEFRARGWKAKVLDGDEIRETTGSFGFSPEERRRHALYVAYLAKTLNEFGICVAVALVSPYRNDRASCREIVGPGFVECFVQCPPAVCEARDGKGLYVKARNGRLGNLTGLNSPYEDPEHPDLLFSTEREDVDSCRNRLSEFLRSKFP